MKKITKLKLANKSAKLRKKHMKEGNLPPVQNLTQKKSLVMLLKQTNPLVLISFGILILASVALVASLIFLVIFNRNTQPMSTLPNTNNQVGTVTDSANSKLPTPTPVPFPAGPQIYSASSKSIIQVKQLYISALDTKIGDPVTMKLSIQDEKSTVKSVTVKIISDKNSQNPVFSLKSGTPNDGTWEGTWVTNDTHWNNYQAEIIIKDAEGNTFSSTPTFR